MAKRNLMQKVLTHLKGRRDIHIPTTMTFPPLDPAAIAFEKQLEERGEERGARNQPPAVSDALDDVESEIVALVEHQKEVAGHTLNDNLGTYAERLGSLDLDHTSIEIGIQAESVLAEFVAELSHGADSVHAARRRVVEHDRYLNRFKRVAKLDRPAHYPNAYFLHFGILLALLAIEAVLNGTFLGETHTFGLLGGVTEAIIIAIVNVGLGAVVGYAVLRECWHRSIFRKLVGVVGTAAYLAAILAFNLAVAHYRDALAAGAWDTATTTALQTVLADPLGVTDIKSWLLFVIGVFFSLIALVDGFRMDDPYPGFGAVTRRRERAEENYRHVKSACLDELSEIKDDAVNAMVATKMELQKARGEFRQILEGRQRFVEQHKAHLRGLEATANNLLAVYREANSAYRTDPAPKRFDERWQMATSADPVFGELDLRKMETSVQHANGVLETRIAEVHAEYKKAIRAFERIEQLSEEELARVSAKEIVEAA